MSDILILMMAIHCWLTNNDVDLKSFLLGVGGWGGGGGDSVQNNIL